MGSKRQKRTSALVRISVKVMAAALLLGSEASSPVSSPTTLWAWRLRSEVMSLNTLLDVYW